MSSTDLRGLLPEAAVLITALSVLIIESALRRKAEKVIVALGLSGYIVALGLAWIDYAPALGAFPMSGHGPVLAADGFGHFFRVLILAAGLASALFLPEYAAQRRLALGELISLHMLASLGMVLTVRSLDMVMLFVSIELSSIALYILTGVDKRDKLSGEAAIKYFLLGILATGILVYGMAWLYGLTGSTQFDAIAARLHEVPYAPGSILALFLLLVGLGFKIAAVPFHMWTPDAYEGAPTPIAAFMSVAPKVAGFAALLRAFAYALGALEDIWLPSLMALSVLTMTLGNLAALTQSSMKRMLAYSSIAHTGYMLVGVSALRAGPEAVTAVLFYTAAYLITNIGAFGIVSWLQNHGARGLVDDFSGLWYQAPSAALAATVFMLSLTGIPATAGFLAKWFVFVAAIKSGLIWLAVLGVLNSALSAYYYLKVVVNVFMKEPAKTLASPSQPLAALALSGLAVLTVLLGIFWGPLYSLAAAAGF